MGAHFVVTAMATTRATPTTLKLNRSMYLNAGNCELYCS
jgi:hypothetical protein